MTSPTMPNSGTETIQDESGEAACKTRPAKDHLDSESGDYLFQVLPMLPVPLADIDK